MSTPSPASIESSEFRVWFPAEFKLASYESPDAPLVRESAPVVSVKVWPATTASAAAVASAAAFAAVSVAASLVTEATAAASSASVDPPSSLVTTKYSAASARFWKDCAMSAKSEFRRAAGVARYSAIASARPAFVTEPLVSMPVASSITAVRISAVTVPPVVMLSKISAAYCSAVWKLGYSALKAAVVAM